MEHINAPALSSYREAKLQNPFCTLGTADAKRILHDMSNALFYVHSQGIIHNDIKPANILYSKARGAVLIDFGLSSEMTDKALHTGGSPWYIPPEYDEATGTRGPPGDVFALGVVMLFLLKESPLPELQWPRLNWIIANVKAQGRIADEARNAMNQWLGTVERTSEGLLEDYPEVEDHTLRNIATMMLDFSVASRVKVDELVQLVDFE